MTSIPPLLINGVDEIEDVEKEIRKEIEKESIYKITTINIPILYIRYLDHICKEICTSRSELIRQMIHLSIRDFMAQIKKVKREIHRKKVRKEYIEEFLKVLDTKKKESKNVWYDGTRLRSQKEVDDLLIEYRKSMKKTRGYT